MIDVHAHYDDPKFENPYNDITNSHNAGVKYIINAGTDLETSRKSIEFAEKFDYVYANVGIHPLEVNSAKLTDLEEIEKMANHPKVVAIGEIGLDYYYDSSTKDLQKQFFEQQIVLSKKLKLPFVVHDRDAHKDTMDILKANLPYTESGIIHCFSGSVEMAKEILKMDLYISIGGALTFKNAKTIIEVAKFMPLDRILLETDAPYMTPEPFRGKKNISSNIKFTAQKLADIKQISIEKVFEQTIENSLKVFKIAD